MVAPYHVGEVDGDEEQGDEARGDGVFQGLRSALRGQVLEPDDEADGQDAEQAEVEIAFAAAPPVAVRSSQAASDSNAAARQ